MHLTALTVYTVLHVEAGEYWALFNHACRNCTFTAFITKYQTQVSSAKKKKNATRIFVSATNNFNKKIKKSSNILKIYYFSGWMILDHSNI